MKKITYVLFSLILISVPFLISADSTVTTPGGPGSATVTTPGAPAIGSTNTGINVSISNPFKGGSDLSSIVTSVLQNIIDPLAAVFVVLAIIYAGFKYITAQGKAKEIQDANQTLLYVLIGTLVLLGANGIALAIQGTVCGQLVSGC